MLRTEAGKKQIRHFRDLDVYKLAFDVAMKVYDITKAFPADEKYSLVDQIRRASRSVCANLAEGWRKRKYEAVFKNKVTDAMQEASETQCWLEFALTCKHATTYKHVPIVEMHPVEGIFNNEIVVVTVYAK